MLYPIPGKTWWTPPNRHEVEGTDLQMERRDLDKNAADALQCLGTSLTTLRVGLRVRDPPGRWLDCGHFLELCQTHSTRTTGLTGWRIKSKHPTSPSKSHFEKATLNTHLNRLPPSQLSSLRAGNLSFPWSYSSVAASPKISSTT